jgi:RNA polymerase sigma-70 factor (ECF subfamily)
MPDNREEVPRAERWGAWLVRAAAGDRSAFAELAAELKPYLLARLRACPCTRDLFRIPDDADDAVHDALLIVWQSRTRFDPRRQVVAWLWTIARNCAVNILRRRTRQRAVSLHDREGQLIPNLAVDAPSPAALAAASEQRRRLRRAIASALLAAEPRVRRAWRWRFREGQPYAVIARRLGVPQGTVATWLHRFKKGMRRPPVA